MNHNVKMIGFDLDGTLLTTEKKLTEYTKEVMQEAISKGILLLPVTGRPYSGVPKELLAFEGMNYVITSNGARVVENGKTIYERLLPVEKARKILDIFEEYDTLREIYYDGQGYIGEKMIESISSYMKAPAMAEYVRTTRLPVSDLRKKFEEENRALDKVQALFACPEEKEKAWQKISALGDVEVTGALDNNIEVNAGNVHKGNALLWLADKFGISRDEIMVFGDGTNDVKMLKSAGIAVAMSNGVESVIEAADVVTCSNDEEGVAKMIAEYVL